MEISCTRTIVAVAFSDEQHIIGCDDKGKIRRWNLEDGTQTGPPMDGGGNPPCISVSKDGKWVASGASCGRVKVWNAEDHSKKQVEFKGHSRLKRVCAMDIFQDRIATGSTDKTVYVWALRTGERQLGPLGHDGELAAVKFSPDGQLLATATWQQPSVRIYNADDASLYSKFSISVASPLNQSLVWSSDGKQLLALSVHGSINCISDASTKTARQSTWDIHEESDKPKWISLASGGTLPGTFVATASDSSVSFWDVTTQRQCGSGIKETQGISSLAILADRIAIAAGKKITLRNVLDIPRSSNHDSTGINPPSLPHTSVHPNEDITKLEQVIQEFRDQLAKFQDQKDTFNEMIESLRNDFHTRNEEPVLDSKVTQKLREVVGAPSTAEFEQETIDTTIGHLRTALQTLDTSTERKIARDQRHKCEDLYGRGNVRDSAIYLAEIVDTMSDDLKSDGAVTDWVAKHQKKCVSDLERSGDAALGRGKPDKALADFSAALSLPSLPAPTLPTKWAKVALAHTPWRKAWDAAAKLKSHRFHGTRAICEILGEDQHRIAEAVECFRRMQTELPQESSTEEERMKWELEFRENFAKKLEGRGDSMMKSANYDEAIEYYSHALSLIPPHVNAMIVKCCDAREGLLHKALADAEKGIRLAPSSYKYYKQKHFALHSIGRYKEAFVAFEMMLTKLDESPVPDIRALREQFVNATPKIREIVQRTVRDIPNVLIDVGAGRLCNKAQQETAFEELPVFNELRSSMIRKVDEERIREEVKKFYKYVMFSHRWQPPEPTFQMLEKITVYKLLASPAHDKLVEFCKLVRGLCFHWAWSDTCCVNQEDKGIQQESVVAMFRWYRGSSLTIVHLLGVSSSSKKDKRLWESVWNTRGWTYQEYVASEVVQFYTEDWKPYLDLAIYNHKKSPKIIAEMEGAMKIRVRELSTLEPGLDRAREKLFLASRRETTREEDIAYCLFGIFGTPLSVIYGEGKQVAVGRLLEYILARSGDATILSWNGSCGGQHSYLPSDFTVYDQIAPPHVPQRMDNARMDTMISTSLHLDPSDFPVAVSLCSRLHELPSLSLVSGRLKLPGIVFQLVDVQRVLGPDGDVSEAVYSAKSLMLDDVEIKTADNLDDMKGLLLIHPWIGPFLDEDFTHGSQSDIEARALRLVVQLKQEFGALLLARQSRSQYRRVATDCMIKVKVRHDTRLDELMGGIQTVEVQ